MFFNSVPFVAFFAIVYTLYWGVRKHRAQNVVLLLASYVFYAWWDWRFVFLLAGTTLVDFFAVKQIEASEGNEKLRRRWMTFSVSVNILVLGFFKYFNFFTDSGVSALHKLGFNLPASTLSFVLPVGISFYVFHEISYAVDVYRRRTPAEHDLTVYAVFVAFFPQLVAGPITRAAHMLPQFRNHREFTSSEDAYSGGVLILSGLFKKVVLADGMAPLVNDTFNNMTGRGFVPLSIAAVGFSIQIYGDFAGYTDIARGVARLLGIDLARNFEQPYLSRNITQFWRTWHMSLSTWLHDYLYVPLGGNRSGKWLTYRNLMITMLLGGLWHGASWHFVVWGALHGVALALHRAFGRKEPHGRPRAPGWRDIPFIAGTFTFVTALWVFFRADSLAAAKHFYAHMLSSPLGSNPGPWKPRLELVVAFFLIMLAIDLVDRHRLALRPLHVWPMWLQGALAGMAVVGLVVWSGAAPQPFIYFRF